MTETIKKTKNKKTKTKATVRTTLCAVFTALICVCSLTAVPQPFSDVPFTLGLFAVILFPALSADGIKAVIIFILMGLIGIPVFSGFRSTDAVLGVTGGYIVGYIPAAIIACIASFMAFKPSSLITPSDNAEPKKSGLFQPVVLTVGFLLAVVACYTLGTAWFMITMEYGLFKALSACVLPFIAVDCAKVALAVMLTMRLRPRIQSMIKNRK